MPNWHIDMYGTVDSDDEAQDAVDEIASAGRDFGLTAVISSPDLTPEEPKPAPKPTAETKK